MKYIQTHIKYPPTAAKNHVQGRVIVQFVVRKDGGVSVVHVVRSVDKDLDEEAVASARHCQSLLLAAKMEKWSTCGTLCQ